MAEPVKYMDLVEFMRFGFLQIASVAIEGSRHLAVRELLFGRPGSGGIQPVGWVPSDE